MSHIFLHVFYMDSNLVRRRNAALRFVAHIYIHIYIYVNIHIYMYISIFVCVRVYIHNKPHEQKQKRHIRHLRFRLSHIDWILGLGSRCMFRDLD